MRNNGLTKANRTRGDALAARSRAGDALRLRIEGRTFREIAVILKADVSTICRDIQRCLRDILQDNADAAETLRALEVERLDALHASIWPAAVGGNLAAIDRVLSIMQRRARLCGLDAPAKVAQTTADGADVPNPFFDMDSATLAATLAAMAEQMKGTPNA